MGNTSRQQNWPEWAWHALAGGAIAIVMMVALGMIAYTGNWFHADKNEKPKAGNNAASKPKEKVPSKKTTIDTIEDLLFLVMGKNTDRVGEVLGRPDNVQTTDGKVIWTFYPEQVRKATGNNAMPGINITFNGNGIAVSQWLIRDGDGPVPTKHFNPKAVDTKQKSSSK